MPTYTIRRTWPEEPHSKDDYLLLVDGKEAGRVYRTDAPGLRECWRWTVYSQTDGGLADTLDDAKRDFKVAIERPALHVICEHMTEAQAVLDDHISGGKWTAEEVVKRLHALLKESDLLRAQYTCGYFPPDTPPDAS